MLKSAEAAVPYCAQAAVYSGPCSELQFRILRKVTVLLPDRQERLTEFVCLYLWIIYLLIEIKSFKRLYLSYLFYYYYVY